MLLSLLKILVFLALVAALAMGITYLLDAENIVLGDVQTLSLIHISEPTRPY